MAVPARFRLCCRGPFLRAALLSLLIWSSLLPALCLRHVPLLLRGKALSRVYSATSLASPPAAATNSSTPAAASSRTSSSRKIKPTRLTPKQATGLNFTDAYGEHDVPIVDTPLWYRLNVRKASEKRVCETLLALSDEPRWRGVITDAYYPQTSYVRFKAKALDVAAKPLVAGLVYVKTRMNPDIADDLERLQGIYGLTKTLNAFVQPLSEEQAEQLESMKGKVGFQLSPEQAQLKKDCYVSIVRGPHKGRYGILMGAKNGRLEVCLRSEYKDDWEIFDLPDLEYLENPPEKDWKTMTAKEAVESLMAKDPRNPTILNLRKQGLLNEILYPERTDLREDRGRVGTGDRYQGGREGGRRIRSIAKADVKTWEKATRSEDASWELPTGERKPWERSQTDNTGAQREAKPWSKPASKRGATENRQSSRDNVDQRDDSLDKSSREGANGSPTSPRDMDVDDDDLDRQVLHD